MKITHQKLVEIGFKKLDQGYWIDLQTHYIELIDVLDFWYPELSTYAELSNEQEQHVPLHPIQYMHELQMIFKVVTGNEKNR